MAKISEIKFELKGVHYKVNVNCTSGGQFNANIPDEIAEALRIDKKITANTLNEILATFNKSLKLYKEAKTSQTLHILIAYQASGAYIERKDGGHLFYYDDKKYTIRTSFNEIENALGLDFKVAICEVIDGKEKWFEAKLGKDHSHIQESQFFQPDVYHKTTNIYQNRLERFKIIPFSQTALDTLNSTQEKFRAISEMLFNFINQDEQQILSTLTNNKLLQ